MTVINNTGLSSVKIFCESYNADISRGNARKIWTLNQPIVLYNPESVKLLMSIESLSVPLSFYTVNDSNNRFSFNGLSYTLEGGYYTANGIVTELNAVGIFTVSFNSFKSKFVFQTAGGASGTINEISNSVYKMLGVVPVTFVGSHTAPSVCNLVYTSGITFR